MKPVNLFDYRELARYKLPKKIFDFIDGGSCDEITQRNNRESFDNISILPLCLRDVSSIDLSVKLLGNDLSSPILIAPTAFHQLLDKQGEISTAKAAKSSGVPLIVSSMSNRSLEDIATKSKHEHLWLQLYIFKRRELTAELILRAEKAGYKAILVTVGAPITGKRDRDVRNQFSLAHELSTGNFKSKINSEVLYNFTAAEFDPSVTWKDIEWLQTLTKLPIILKGILNPIDAEIACQLKLAGIVVSNHGGRQLDTAEASILALPDIANTVAGRTMLLLDSGIRRGTDVFKALALGADAILLGRPVLWALAVNGKTEVEAMLSLLKEELEIAMKLTGCSNVNEIKQFSKYLNYLVPRPLKNV